MKISDQQTINAPRERVFAALNDADVLRRCIPGCESLDKHSDTAMDAVVALKIGPVKARFNGSVTLENLNPPESYTIVGEGKGGSAGFAKGSAAVTLTEQNGATVLAYDVDVAMGGKIAQLGSRLMQGTTKKLSSEFFGKFGEIVEANGEEAIVETEDVTEPIPETEPEPAKRNRTLEIAAGVAVVGLIVILVLTQL